MDLNNDRLEQATLKVNKLRELKEAIQNRMDVNDVDDPRLAHIADMLRSIEGTANGLVQ